MSTEHNVNQYIQIKCIFIHQQQTTRNEIKYKTPFTIAFQNMKFIGPYLTKYV